MKNLCFVLLASWPLFVCQGEEEYKYVPPSPAVKRARVWGAKAKLIFKVVDDEGRPVPDADIGVDFYMGKRPGENPYHKGITDTNGVCVLEGKTTLNVLYRLSKDGYYVRRGEHYFFTSLNRGEVISGKWQPYGLEIPVVLNRIKNPQIFNETNGESGNWCCFPKEEVFIGFDLQKNDWMPPYGKGEVCDFELAAFTDKERDSPTFRGMKLKVRFVRKYDGAYMKKYDKKSVLRTDYCVAEDLLSGKELSFFERINPETKKYESFKVGEDNYLVLRTRSKVDSEGNFIGAQYSKTYCTSGVGFGFAVDDETDKPFVRINCLVNPKFNDTNLETVNEAKRWEESKVR